MLGSDNGACTPAEHRLATTRSLVAGAQMVFGVALVLAVPWWLFAYGAGYLAGKVVPR